METPIDPPTQDLLMTDPHDRIPLTVPQMGVVEEVILIEWLVEPGSRVAAGQEVVVVESEKAEVVLEAPASGALDIAIGVSDEEIPVGTALAYITP